MFIPLLMLLGIGVAMFRRSPQTFLDGSTEDAPLRLLRWTAGLLSASSRDEWGQAMLGELDHIEGRSRRWRFAIGCLGGAVLLPPWGRAAGGVLAMVAMAVGSLGLYASVVVRYGLGTGSWVGAAIVLVILISFIFAASALLRRPGVAVPGLLGGLFVALAWLGMAGFTFSGVIAGIPRTGEFVLVLVVVVPAMVGVAGTLSGGSAAAGRRTARLAAVSAGVGLYLYGTLAVAVLGAGGPPEDTTFTVRYIVGDRLGTNLIFDLMVLPLVTATVGWGAAAATARIRRLATDTDSVVLTAAGPGRQPMTTPEMVGSTVPLHSRHRTSRIMLLGAITAAIVLLSAATWLRT